MSYYGPAFSGIKKDFNAKSLVLPDITSVLMQGLDQFNSGKVRKVLPESLRIASRTDIGVHATRNAFTFNTTEPNDKEQLLKLVSFHKGMN
jgi:tRNA U38,U39,U40 pseudouridine synthase TruA